MRNGLVLKRGKIHRLVKASKERSLCPFVDDLHGMKCELALSRVLFSLLVLDVAGTVT